ncbi:MAG: AAA family ATPase, partial [Anaerolineae bacterium]
MAALTLRLLGNPEVTVGQQPLSFPTRKVLALLIYLVVEGGMHSRESLMALLWPESPSKNAAVTLRGTLSRLRKSLPAAGQFLVSEAGKVGFDFKQSFDLDLAWLAKAVLPEASPEDLAAILDFDRGEFLAGFSLPDAPDFDTWAAIQREACQRQVEMVYDRLSQHQLANYESTSAVETAARWVARASLSEVAYRRLMAAQALAGDRPAALKTYGQCRAMLEQEFGIEPARETAVLAEHISRDRVPEGPGDVVAERGSPLVMPAPPGSRGLPLPFEDRADEHSQLVAAFRQAGEEGTRVVTIIGAAGVGKTRLINAFQEWVVLDSPGVEMWQGRAFEMGGRLPYQPVIEAMRVRLEQENAPEDLLEDVWLAELSQLLPELRARYPDLPLPMAGDANFVRSRLFAAVATLGNALAARRPAVFVLDDMQWADAETLDMVHYMAQRWAESGVPILLLLAVRQESFAADSRLREWLTGLGRDVPLTRLFLDTLSGTAVQQLVSRLAGPAADEEATHAFAAWLWAETRGLPFFIEALLQMLVEQGMVATTEAGSRLRCDFAAALIHVRSVAHLPVPPAVRNLILARLERLSEAAAALLLAGAVLGRECSFERLCQVAGLAELDALKALEALLNGRLLAESSSARRPYTLAHDYIREVVYSESHEARRRVFHRRALLALEADRAPAAECAFHALASLLDEPAFRFSLAAGDEALETFALEESLAHYDRARDAARMMGLGTTAVAPEHLLRLYQNRGRVLELANRYQAAQANYREMIELAQTRNDPVLK